MAGKQKVYVAFLRGINVGGNALISMTELKRYFEDLGFRNVATYINSGNVIFQSATADKRKLEGSISKALADHFGKEIAVVVLDVDSVDAILDSIPPSWRKPADERRNVMFLRHTIDDPSILDNFRPKPDIELVKYVPGALLWSAKTSALTRSAMLKVASSPLYKDMTIRTLGTVEKVQKLMHASDVDKQG